MTRRAFTLLEALIALGIILLLVGTMTSVISNVANSRDRMRERSVSQLGATAAFELLSSAADTCLADDGNGSAGIEGGPLRLRITRSGVAARRLFQGVGAASPLADHDHFELGLEGRDLVVNGEDPDQRSTLIANLVAIRFRYHDGEEWLEQWDSSLEGLPRAIQMSIWTTPWPAGEQPSWMPEEGKDDMEEAEEAPLVAESTGDLPPPDKQRIVAIFDPATNSPAIDGLSTAEDDLFEDFEP